MLDAIPGYQLMRLVGLMLENLTVLLQTLWLFLIHIVAAWDVGALHGDAAWVAWVELALWKDVTILFVINMLQALSIATIGTCRVKSSCQGRHFFIRLNRLIKVLFVRYEIHDLVIPCLWVVIARHLQLHWFDRLLFQGRGQWCHFLLLRHCWTVQTGILPTVKVFIVDIYVVLSESEGCLRVFVLILLRAILLGPHLLGMHP